MHASLPFLLVPRRPCPNFMCPRSMCVHAKAMIRNQQTSNGRKKMQRACEKGIKQIGMVDMANIAYGRRHDKPQDKQTDRKARRQTGKQANKKEDKQAKRQTKGGVHGGQM